LLVDSRCVFVSLAAYSLSLRIRLSRGDIRLQ